MYLLSIYYPRKSSSLSPNEKMVQYVRETMREKFNEICIFFLFYTPPPLIWTRAVHRNRTRRERFRLEGSKKERF